MNILVIGVMKGNRNPFHLEDTYIKVETRSFLQRVSPQRPWCAYCHDIHDGQHVVDVLPAKYGDHSRLGVAGNKEGKLIWW